MELVDRRRSALAMGGCVLSVCMGARVQAMTGNAGVLLDSCSRLRSYRGMPAGGLVWRLRAWAPPPLPISSCLRSIPGKCSGPRIRERFTLSQSAESSSACCAAPLGNCEPKPDPCR